VSNVLINIDHGSLPGGAEGIKYKANINNWSFGVLGSVVYLGLTLGSAVASASLSNGALIKPTLGVTLFMNAACYYGFTTTSSFYMMVLIRGLIGFFQVFICIYMPVWADTYGSEK
jgi:sugar phosphate permease